MSLGLWALLATNGSAWAEPAADLKAFPPADPGFERHVLRLPPIDTEADRKLEVIVGKDLDMDCNHTWFTGDLERVSIPGWGFDRFLVQAARPATTLRGCISAPLRRAFAQVRGDGFLVEYNSRLPVVVYVPVGFDVRYRVWAPGGELPIAAE